MANIAKRPDGRWHSRHVTRKVDAQNWLDLVRTAVTTGTYADLLPSSCRWSLMGAVTAVDAAEERCRDRSSAAPAHVL